MGEEKDAQTVAETGIKHTSVKKESTDKASYDAVMRSSSFITKEAVDLKKPGAPATMTLPPRGSGNTYQKPWKRNTSTMVRSPRNVREQNDAAVSAAQTRYARQQRQWKAAVKVMSSIVQKLSPVIVLKRARDCYVNSLGNFASHVSYSAASGLTYGAGHSSLDNLPVAWRSGSNRYQEQQIVDSERSWSAAFKQSFNDTATCQLSKSSRTFASVPQFTPGAASRSLRFSSARASSRFGMQPMPIYTIKEI